MKSKFYEISLSFIILSLLVLGLNTKANASMTNNPDPDRLGSIRIHRLAGTDTGNPTNGTALNGIPYTITRVRLRDGLSPNPLVLRDVNNFEVIDGVDAFTMTATTQNGVATFDDLPQGMYKVVEGNHSVTVIYDRIDPFVVGIPRNVDGEWMYEVDVYPKTFEDFPTNFEKLADVSWDQNKGTFVIDWFMSLDLPRLIGNATRLEIIDTLPSNVTFVPNSVEIFFTTNLGARGVLPSDGFVVTENGNEISIALTQAGFDYFSQHANFPEWVTDHAPQFQINISTTINSDRTG